MKYLLMETDKKNKYPYNINKNQAIDGRLLTKQNMNKLPLWNVLEMDFPDEGFFPDLLCNPWILVSECCIKTILMYQPDVPYKGMKLWDPSSGINATYFVPFLDEIPCLSDQCKYNSVGNRVLRLALNRDRIGDKAVFRIKGYDRKCVIGRMDFAESLLRRGASGIKLEELDIDEKCGL